jgi:hypothetical protein
MDSVNEESSNSVMTSGAAGGLPNDGTGSYTKSLLLQIYTDLVTGVVKLDPWLAPYKESLRRRYVKAQDWITAINNSEGGLEKFSRVSIAVSVPW